MRFLWHHNNNIIIKTAINTPKKQNKNSEKKKETSLKLHFPPKKEHKKTCMRSNTNFQGRQTIVNVNHIYIRMVHTKHAKLKLWFKITK